MELEYRDLQLCLDRHYKCQRSLRGRHRTKINYRIANLEPKLAKAWSAYLKVIRRLDYQSEQYRITRERETDFFWRLTRP